MKKQNEKSEQYIKPVSEESESEQYIGAAIYQVLKATQKKRGMLLLEVVEHIKNILFDKSNVEILEQYIKEIKNKS